MAPVVSKSKVPSPGASSMTTAEILILLKTHAPWCLAASWVLLAPIWLALVWWLVFIGISLHCAGWLYRHFTRSEVKEKTVLITGGAQGLGKATAMAFAAQGNKIILWDILEDKLKETATEIKKAFNVTVHTCVVDITKDAEIQKAVEDCETMVGYVDIVVLNAGVISGYSLIDLPMEKMRRVYEVNAFQLYSVGQAYLRKMVRTDQGKARGGHFVIISSMSAYLGVNKMTDYGATKAAAVNFTDALAAEIHSEGYNVKTSLVCPYYINTGMFSGTTPISFFPFLEEKDVANEIYEAVARKRQLVVLPWHMYTMNIAMKLVMPTFTVPFVDKIFGFSKSMVTFNGRHV